MPRPRRPARPAAPSRTVDRDARRASRAASLSISASAPGRAGSRATSVNGRRSAASERRHDRVQRRDHRGDGERAAEVRRSRRRARSSPRPAARRADRTQATSRRSGWSSAARAAVAASPYGPGTGQRALVTRPPLLASLFLARRLCSAALSFASAYDWVDEHLPARPPERPHDQDDREDDVPGRDRKLLADRVRGRRRRVRHVPQRGDVERLVHAHAAGGRPRRVRDRVAADDLHHVWKRDRDPVRGQEDGDHAELATSRGTRAGRRGGNSHAGGEDRAAAFACAQSFLSRLPRDAAEDHDQDDPADEIAAQPTGGRARART